MRRVQISKKQMIQMRKNKAQQVTKSVNVSLWSSEKGKEKKTEII